MSILTLVCLCVLRPLSSPLPSALHKRPHTLVNSSAEELSQFYSKNQPTNGSSTFIRQNDGSQLINMIYSVNINYRGPKFGNQLFPFILELPMVRFVLVNISTSEFDE